MRRSPRRPLILKRRKLPFQQNDQPAPASQNESNETTPKEASTTSATHCFPDGIRIMDHPAMPDTQVVVIPKTADLQSVIGALTAKGKECGPNGPNKFILLSGSGSLENESFSKPSFEDKDISTMNKELDCSPLDDSLTNIQWLGGMSTVGLGPNHAKKEDNPNRNPNQAQGSEMVTDTVRHRQPMPERPPYSYMAMIQFAINSKTNRMMTLKEIYTWIEDHFPYFREVAKPGWKNSIRHNLSLHDMFTRESTPDGKVSFWTIRPEANRCLTLDQVYKPGCDPTSTPIPVPVLFFPHEKRTVPDARKSSLCSERKMKPLLPRTDSYLVPIQLPLTSSLYLPSSSMSHMALSASRQRRTSSRGSRRVRIAPKVSVSDASSMMGQTPTVKEIKVEQMCLPLSSETPRAPPRREASSSRRKQRLVLPKTEEPVLLFSDSTFFDSGVASDASVLQDVRHAELETKAELDSPNWEYSFKTPIKSSSHLASSTPSKPPPNAIPEVWRLTPLGKQGRDTLDFSPIRTPNGPTLTPKGHDFSSFSFSSTPFKELPLFNSSRELLSNSGSRATGPAGSPSVEHPSHCSRELLQAGGHTPGNHSFTEGLVLDTMNDSLSKILVDISFSGLEDEDLGMANISWSEFIPQLK
ncbi:forkhead box protein M1 [Lampris incognitus]|uniref:forkhead box protein M1 n=1 Tax=Lampris incognitus TaxID=2546036 RepID=UPI0024B553F0|nr:forkhead box protein M1 [Lampris incognitus]